jgi:hypothetical protein
MFILISKSYSIPVLLNVYDIDSLIQPIIESSLFFFYSYLTIDFFILVDLGLVVISLLIYMYTTLSHFYFFHIIIMFFVALLFLLFILVFVLFDFLVINYRNKLFFCSFLYYFLNFLLYD